MKQKLKNEEMQLIKENYLIKGPHWCAKQLRIPFWRVRYQAKKLKIKHKYYDENGNYQGLHTIKKVDAEQFKNITSPEIAYILGLLWADGHVVLKKEYAGIILNNQYRDHVYFKKVFKKTGNWNFYLSKKKRPLQDQGVIQTSNRLLANYLTSMDYKSKSLSPDKIINSIPEDLKHFWYMGFLDGDGCIFINKTGSTIVSFVGPFEQDWSFIENICHKLKINYQIHRSVIETGKRSHIRIGGNYQCQKILDYIYQNESFVVLPRKLKKYKQLKDYLKRQTRNKSINQIDPKTNLIIKTWANTRTAASSFNKDTEIVRGEISKVLRKIKKDNYICKTAYGYKWEYTEN